LQYTIKAGPCTEKGARLDLIFYNNISFVPSYGAIQGSQQTRRRRRGNAYDTASLLIALLRAAQVPARYVYGTVEKKRGQARFNFLILNFYTNCNV